MRESYYIIDRYYYFVIVSAALATRICMCAYMYAVERGWATCHDPVHDGVMYILLESDCES